MTGHPRDEEAEAQAFAPWVDRFRLSPLEGRSMDPRAGALTEAMAAMLLGRYDELLCLVYECTELTRSPIERALLYAMVGSIPSRVPGDTRYCYLRAPAQIAGEPPEKSRRWLRIPGAVWCSEDLRSDGDAPLMWGEYARYYEHVTIRPQARILGYVADFLVEFHADLIGDPFSSRFVVECDGHDFHERTKEQAAHDRKRDRVMQHEGIGVLRFTGSEIWKDPMACGREIRDAVRRPFRKRLAEIMTKHRGAP